MAQLTDPVRAADEAAALERSRGSGRSSSRCWWAPGSSRSASTSSATCCTTCDVRGISTGFDFLSNRAGFAINQSLIDYDETSSYGRTFFVGLLNTLLVSGLGHRAGDHARLHHRRGAAVAQLAGRQARGGLHRDLPQHPAAAADPVLVFRRVPATCRSPQRGDAAWAMSVFLNAARPVPAAAGVRKPASGGRARVRGGGRRRRSARALGAPPPGAHRASCFPAFRVSLALVVGLPLARLPGSPGRRSPGACRSSTASTSSAACR